MDASRLSGLVGTILEDHAKLEIPQKWGALVQKLNEYVKQPNDATSGEFEKALNELQGLLGECKSNEFQPIRRAMMEHVGATGP